MIDQEYRNEDTEKVVRALSDYVNSGSRFDRAEFADAVLREHRTLQQLLFGLFGRCIIEWAELAEKGHFDGRNEHTVKTCHLIVELLKERGEDYVFEPPLI